MEEENECPDCPQLPGWLATFADLMSLLMCFFVLLLSFSEMDVQKYKRVAGSLKFAFGVQREVNVKDNKTRSLGEGKSSEDSNQRMPKSKDSIVKPLISEGMIKARLAELAENKAQQVKRALKKEIESGLLEVVREGDKVIIRMRERGFFQTGRANIATATESVLQKVADALSDISGDLVISGHTDNVPIANDEFRSNWELSSTRAANVVHFMRDRGGVPAERLEIRAHATGRDSCTEHNKFE